MAAAIGPATKPQAQADTATATGSGWRVFVGQLPFYLENDKIIRKHFQEVGCKIKAVRMLSDKKTKKFRGIAFLELEDKESLVQALTLHQSRLGHKKINVEISSGGGGNGAKRKHKNKAGRERIDKQLEAKRERQRAKKQVCASELPRGVCDDRDDRDDCCWCWCLCRGGRWRVTTRTTCHLEPEETPACCLEPGC